MRQDIVQELTAAPVEDAAEVDRPIANGHVTPVDHAGHLPAGVVHEHVLGGKIVVDDREVRPRRGRTRGVLQPGPPLVERRLRSHALELRQILERLLLHLSEKGAVTLIGDAAREDGIGGNRVQPGEKSPEHRRELAKGRW